MNAVAQQFAAHASEVEVLKKIRRQTVAQALMNQFQGTNVQSLVIRLHDLGFMVSPSTALIPEGTSLEDIDTARDNVFTRYSDDGKFDAMENGNAGVLEFLELGIEWSDMMAIIDDITAQFGQIADLYDLQRNHNAVVMTTDGQVFESLYCGMATPGGVDSLHSAEAE